MASDRALTPTSEIKLIAFYLPQFHPIPENDEWWGKGFTEWTNVTKATPLFAGHYQPHRPADLGYYDLRVRETRWEQISLAKQYGIDGFCYHYYWFSGKRLLSRPVDDMLSDANSDMPFCLCWANENWTRRWDAADHEVLIAQKYRPEDDINFIESLVPFFRDERYIHVDGRPLLVVYRPQHIPDAFRSAAVWREHCRSIGLGEIHLCAALTHGNSDYRKFGFDSGVEFPPHNLRSANINDQISFFEPFAGNVMQYRDIGQSYIERVYTDNNNRVFKSVFPSWDNTARTGSRALVVLNGTPENYEYWLASTIDSTQTTEGGDRIVFINAWNEWAEGCHLEPDYTYGHRFLQATLDAKRGVRRYNEFTHVGLPRAEDAYARSLWNDCRGVMRYHGAQRFGELKLEINKRPWLRRAVLETVRLMRRVFSRS